MHYCIVHVDINVINIINGCRRLAGFVMLLCKFISNNETIRTVDGWKDVFFLTTNQHKLVRGLG